MAGAPPQVQVQGGRKLRKALKDAGLSVDDLKAAHAAAARTVEQAARAAVPHRSGTLAASIRSSGTASAAVVRAGGARVPYAGAIHWGWPRRNIAPQQFITGPASDTEPQWLGAYMTALEAILAEIERTADGTGE